MEDSLKELAQLEQRNEIENVDELTAHPVQVSNDYDKVNLRLRAAGIVTAK